MECLVIRSGNAPALAFAVLWAHFLSDKHQNLVVDRVDGTEYLHEEISQNGPVVVEQMGFYHFVGTCCDH